MTESYVKALPPQSESPQWMSNKNILKIWLVIATGGGGYSSVKNWGLAIQLLSYALNKLGNMRDEDKHEFQEFVNSISPSYSTDDFKMQLETSLGTVYAAKISEKAQSEQG